jgi:transcriptional regulator with XRE-family HTH domain
MEGIFSYEEIETKLGDAAKRLRLLKNMTRQTLCDQAGISMNALRHLEGGQGATVKTLIRVTKSLGKTDWLLGLSPEISINPLDMIRGKSRQRARKQNLSIESASLYSRSMKKQGTVYFMAAATGAIKIGYSKQPSSRLKSLQTANSEQLTLIKAYPGTPSQEVDLHNKFRTLRLKGEWYSPGPALIKFIHDEAPAYFAENIAL